jgi:hypothetical protein
MPAPPWTTTKAFLLFAGVVVWSILIIIPIRTNGLDGSDVGGVLFSILAFPPTFIIGYILYTRLISPIFDDDVTNDGSVTPVTYIVTYMALSVAWSLIYLFFWLQDRATFENIALVDNAYSAWAFLVYSAVLTGFGTAPAHAIPTKSLVSLVTAVHTVVGWASSVILVAELLVIYSDFRKRRKTGAEKRDERPPPSPQGAIPGRPAPSLGTMPGRPAPPQLSNDIGTMYAFTLGTDNDDF